MICTRHFAQTIGCFDLFSESYLESEEQSAVCLYQNASNKRKEVLANVIINEEYRSQVPCFHSSTTFCPAEVLPQNAIEMCFAPQAIVTIQSAARRSMATKLIVNMRQELNAQRSAMSASSIAAGLGVESWQPCARGIRSNPRRNSTHP